MSDLRPGVFRTPGLFLRNISWLTYYRPQIVQEKPFRLEIEAEKFNNRNCGIKNYTSSFFKIY